MKAQNMAKNHLCKHCRLIPDETRNQLLGLRDCKRRAAGGKKYWTEGVKVLGVIETNDGLRFQSTLKSNMKSNKDNDRNEEQQPSSSLTTSSGVNNNDVQQQRDNE
jgi:hypothetical protein